MEQNKIHKSGLNIIENSDGSFSFEWDPKDERWSWMNNLTDEEIKVIIEETIQNPIALEDIFNDIQSLGSNE